MKTLLLESAEADEQAMEVDQTVLTPATPGGEPRQFGTAAVFHHHNGDGAKNSADRHGCGVPVASRCSVFKDQAPWRREETVYQHPAMGTTQNRTQGLEH